MLKAKPYLQIILNFIVNNGSLMLLTFSKIYSASIYESRSFYDNKSSRVQDHGAGKEDMLQAIRHVTGKHEWKKWQVTPLSENNELA